MRPLAKILTYAALFAGAAAFLLPLLWMVSTALKPIEQTMVQPPQWLPRRHEVGASGDRREVRLGALITTPSVQATPEGTAGPVLLPAAAVRDGRWRRAAGEPVPVTVMKEVPASEDAPWREVVDVATGRREVVPVTAITSRLAPRWENFRGAIRAMGQFWRHAGNTLLLCVLNVVGTVLSSALAAYGFSRIEWRGRDRAFWLVLATMMVPFPVVMVPMYALFRALGWVGTLHPLWVGAFFANAFNVFLLRQFFRNLPRDLSEAARIDGCGEFRIFWQIILPLCRPALMVVALFTFLATWNDFLGPLIYLTDRDDFTLALALHAMQESRTGGTEWHFLMAASTLVVLPIVVLFLAAQRTFIEGIALTGSKN